ncbi:MAG: hypothetical protein M3N07_05005 [Pseudomonadota bacterium]|nr:hypothetical protein [Pseudomonadota bacterium]
MRSELIEAANRAEATAKLIRSGFRVYRPEADCEGEDLVLRSPNGDLRPVQLKGRPFVNRARYGGNGLWMLFPSASFNFSGTREWYLIPHDMLYDYVAQRHGAAPNRNEAWSYPYVPEHLKSFLGAWRVTGRLAS